MGVYSSLSRPANTIRRFMHRIRVPADIDSVTRIDTANESDPLEAGIGQAQADSIWQAVQGLYRTGYYPAVMFCLRRQGRIVFNRSIGHVCGNGPLDEADAHQELATPSTPSCIFSASKAITAMLMHRMEEHGQLNLRNPISHYIPEFASHGKERTTICQLLSHRAGIPGIEGVTDPRIVLDHEQSLRLLCEAAPLHLLGRRQAYHAVTGGVILAEIVKRVSGMDIRKAWRTWFKEPMGLKVLDYGATDRVRARMTREALTGIQGCSLVDDFARGAIGATFGEVMALAGTADFYRAIIPSGNMVTTAEEVGRFYQMLLDGGRCNGRQILRPETIQRATMEVGPHVFDRTIGIPLRFSQGFMLGGAPYGLFGRQSHNAFGHLGLVNNVTWADPERAISVALLVSGVPLLAGNVGALIRLMARISSACPRTSLDA
ncbi:MAG: serine hydrolase [Pseudomonadales bacterium]|nr:serine hydrolase [Pseudomonadales bacterium]